MAGSILSSGSYLEKDHFRIILLGVLTLGIFIVNVFGFVFGITIVFPHLFYLPIILASYWYPRQGITFAAITAAVYLVVSFILSPPDLPTFFAAVCRAAVFIIVGGVVAYLSRNLREQEERYRGLFDHSQAGTLLVRIQEGDFVIEEDNPRVADLLGGNGAPLAASRISRFWPDEEPRLAFIRVLQKEGAVHDAEAELVKNGGQPIAALISGSVLSGDRAILTIEDITDRKRMEDALRSANEKLNTLSGMTRHELLNAITALVMQIDLGKIENATGPLAVLFGKLEEAIRRVQRRIELTRDYQDLGARPADWQHVQDIIRESASRIDFGGITLRPWTERLDLYADPLIRTAFQNLLENTVRHAKGASWILVTYRQLPDGCEVIFEDNGPGIPVQKKESIFSYRPGKQEGMGLFLVREILGVTGLSIREEGEPGKGARFVIRAPADRFRVV